MDAHATQETKEKDGKEARDPKKVKFSVDNHPWHLPPGPYVVSDLKALVKVPDSKELDEVVDGALTPLSDAATINLTEGAVFFSHVRRGGSS